MDLALSVDREMGLLAKRREPLLDAEFRKLRAEVLKRDKNTCQACGIQSMQGMEVATRDPDGDRHTAAELAAVCPICNSTRHVGLKHSEWKEDDHVVYLPEISQTHLSRLMHAVLSTWSEHDNWTTTSNNAIRLLWSRKDSVEILFGTDANKATVFGGMLHSLDDKAYSQRRKLTRNLRLLVNPKNFVVEMRAFKQSYESIPKASWMAVARSAAPELFESQAQGALL